MTISDDFARWFRFKIYPFKSIKILHGVKSPNINIRNTKNFDKYYDEPLHIQYSTGSGFIQKAKVSSASSDRQVGDSSFIFVAFSLLPIEDLADCECFRLTCSYMLLD